METVGARWAQLPAAGISSCSRIPFQYFFFFCLSLSLLSRYLTKREHIKKALDTWFEQNCKVCERSPARTVLGRTGLVLELALTEQLLGGVLGRINEKKNPSSMVNRFQLDKFSLLIHVNFEIVVRSFPRVT